MVLVEENSNAHLECYVDSNPVSEKVITWKRRKNESERIVPLGSSSFEDESSSRGERMRPDVEIFTEESGPFADGAKMKSSLVVINATLQDSGTSFDCIADNGIGKES